MKLGFPIVWTIVTKFDSGRARTSDLPRVRRITTPPQKLA